MAFVPAKIGEWLRGLAEDEQTATIAAHLAACRDRGAAPSTLGSKYLLLTRVQRQVGAQLEDVAERELRRWWRGQVGRSPSTRRGYLSHLRTFYGWAVREDLREDDPTRRLDAPRVRPNLPKPAPEAPTRRMLAELDGTHEWLPIALAVYAGLRVAEICRVEPQHVERDADGGDVLRVRGKGSTEWLVPIPRVLADRLRALPPDAPAVRGRYGKGYTVDGLQHAISRLMDEHDVPGAAHSLRHLYGTRVHRRTKDLLATQRLMRHASPSTTSGYAAMDVTALRDASEAVWHDLGAATGKEES